MPVKESIRADFAHGLENFSLDTGRPASHQVHDFLRREIITGRIAPGASLSEANLCAYFGVSRQPVREALLRLSMQSLVRVYPQRGSIVTRISVPMVLRAQLIREAVEVEALRRALNNVSKDFLKDLENELTVQQAFIEIGDTDRFFQADQNFHRRICDQSGLKGIWENLQVTRSQLDRARHAELRAFQDLPTLVRQHEEIVASIRAGDAPAAEAAMRTHLRRITSQLAVTKANAPHLFDEDEHVDLSSAM